MYTALLTVCVCDFAESVDTRWNRVSDSTSGTSASCAWARNLSEKDSTRLDSSCRQLKVTDLNNEEASIALKIQRA